MAAIAAAKLNRERVGRRWLIAPAGRIAVVVAGLCAAGLLAASPGYAGVGHPFITSFEGKQAPNRHSLGSPKGVAVDEATGEVDVVDYEGGPESEVNGVHIKTSGIDVFSGFVGSYGYLRQIEGKETPLYEHQLGAAGIVDEKSLLYSTDIAVDQSTGRVYVTNRQEEVDAFDATGKYLFDIKPGGEPALPKCGVPAGLAVNAQGNLYVLCGEFGVVAEFNSEGKYLSQIATYEADRAGYSEFIPGAGELAVNASDEIYVTTIRKPAGSAEAGTIAVDKFNAKGEYVATIDAGEANNAAVAVDPATQDVYVAHRRYIAEYGDSGELISRFGAPNVNGPQGGEAYGLAVDGATGEVYAIDASDHRVEVFGGEVPAPDVATEAPSALGETVATLNGAVNPSSAGEAASYQFEYSTSKTELEGSNGTLSPATPAGLGAGTTPEPVSASITGLAPNRTYYYRLLAYNHAGAVRVESEVATFTTTGPPEVSEAFIADAGSTSAVLDADLNPGGLRATYKVEYGTGTEFGSSTAEVTLGAEGHEPVAVALTVSGLQPETTYHVRLVASNADSTAPALGADEMFTTFPVNTGLPDGRVYELVTPLDNHDADVYSPAFSSGLPGKGEYGVGGRLPFQASEAGDAVTYAGEPTSGGNGSTEGGLNANQYLATRSASGWTQQNVSAPGVRESRYEAFSPDLSAGVLVSGTRATEPPALLPEAQALAGYPVLYARTDESGAERALFTSFEGTPPAKNTLFEKFAGASEGYDTLLFEASAALTEAAPSGTAVNDLYESRDGQLQLVNEVEGTTVPYATFGGPSGFDRDEPIAGSEFTHIPDFSHDVSADGKRVFWTAVTPVKNAKGEIEGEQPRALYMTEAGAETVKLDASKIGGAGGDGLFWTASSDGSRVFFTDPNRLTEASTAAAGQSDLYEYEVESGQLLDLTVDPGAHADVQGVIGASEDGSYVYFVADGVLGDGAAHGATQGTCEQDLHRDPASTEECNLYVWHEGVTSFIAPLTGVDGLGADPSGFWVKTTGYIGDWAQGLGERTAEVTPSGEALVFQSTLKLSAYENAGLTEIYSYDAVSGGLACVSCNPSGERAQPSRAPFAAGLNLGGFLDPSATATHATRWMSDDGDRVFFDSAVPLVPEDTNGLVDVYEWEREGTPGGSCPVLSPARLDGGCVFLLSGGTSDNNSYLYSVSASGNDVFFATRAQLVEADQSETFQVYDARVGGVQPPVAPSCSGTGCQGVPSAPPIFATPSSVTFEGIGNFPAPAPVKPAATPKAKPLTRAQELAKALKACAKVKQGAKRASCVKRARKRYGPVKPKRKSASKKRGK